MNFDKFKEISFALHPHHDLHKRCKHFSFIVYKKKILSIGLNNNKTHPKNLKYSYVNKYNKSISELVGTHSELNAIIKLGYEDCSDFILVNTRINRNMEIDNSKPCCGCTTLIKNLNFKKVFYTDMHGKFIEMNI